MVQVTEGNQGGRRQARGRSPRVGRGAQGVAGPGHSGWGKGRQAQGTTDMKRGPQTQATRIRTGSGHMGVCKGARGRQSV